MIYTVKVSLILHFQTDLRERCNILFSLSQVMWFFKSIFNKSIKITILSVEWKNVKQYIISCLFNFSKSILFFVQITIKKKYRYLLSGENFSKDVLHKDNLCIISFQKFWHIFGLKETFRFAKNAAALNLHWHDVLKLYEIKHKIILRIYLELLTYGKYHYFLFRKYMSKTYTNTKNKFPNQT